MISSKKELQLLVKTIKKLTGLNQGEISIKAGYKPQGLTQAMSRVDNHDQVIKRLKIAFGKVLEGVDLPEVETMPTPVAVSNDTVHMQAIMRLIANTEILSTSNAEAIHNTSVLVDTNKKLVDRVLEQQPANAPQQSEKVVAATLGGFQELLLKVATGSKFRSVEEAKAVVDKAFSDNYQAH